MSHIFYLTCMSHVPYERSDEVGHNTTYLPSIRKMLKERQEIVDHIIKMNEISDGWFELDMGDRQKTTQAWFMYHHRNCELGLTDEYRKWYSIDGDSTDPIEKPDSVSKAGVWAVYFWDLGPNVLSIHHMEIDALRAAQLNNGKTIFVPYGEDFRNTVLNE